MGFLHLFLVVAVFAMTPTERRLRASAAAHSRWAKTPDRKTATAKQRSAFIARFEDQVDPDRKLDPATRAKLVDNALKAYMSSLALKSAVARRKGRETARLAEKAQRLEREVSA